jgi:hypothetical protein
MKTVSGQAGLFDVGPVVDPAEAAHARARMRAMIDRLRSGVMPGWKDQMGPILDDGAFKRAMASVPMAEAEALWAEYDALMDGAYAVWAEAKLAAPK